MLDSRYLCDYCVEGVMPGTYNKGEKEWSFSGTSSGAEFYIVVRVNEIVRHENDCVSYHTKDACPSCLADILADLKEQSNDQEEK